MRVTMIHALAESIPPVRLAFGEVFPEAEVVNLLDEGLLIDFDGQLTPHLRRRMSNVIGYCQDNKADAIGLACSVYAPVVDSAKHLVDVPLVSSYGPVMAEAVSAGTRIGLIASVQATMADSEFYLKLAAEEAGVEIEPVLCLAEDLITVLRAEGQVGLERRLEQEVLGMAKDVDMVVLTQFSFAAALAHLEKVSPVPVLSAPHSSARALKQLLA
ncbi:MAG: hypothetical protein CL902_04255 [Dehalococcoidia bacterium]|nr:hypothetical protein [Dehalococcoidia bacterium]